MNAGAGGGGVVEGNNFLPFIFEEGSRREMYVK